MKNTIIDLIKDNPTPFTINNKYTGYVNLSLLNPYELIIFEDIKYYGSLRTDMPHYQVIKLNQVESINEA